ncbi:hypothetical protein [Bradyrhizobium sp.]|jgi:hypothetical protein|uniref:hypothetical protein n=1 Tax=Bradyrhizobium sp. TaxID=376 RepID=UPI0025BC3CB9|nr:hypothetical protein [Bradyrhizobium sp.]
MRHAPFIATRFASFETEREQSKARKSIFRIVVEALHHSRRLQAERTIRQYRHLVHKAESNIPCEQNK